MNSFDKYMRITRRALAAVCFLCLGTGGFAQLGSLGTWESGLGDKFEGAVIENLRMVHDTDGTEALRLSDNDARMDASVDLLLSGNSIKDMKSPFYTIRAEDVIIDNVLPLLGTGSMRFVQPENRVILVPRPGALLAESEDMGSFSVDFWIYPVSRYDEEEVLSRCGSVLDENGRYYDAGMRIFFRNNRLVLSFHNVLSDSRGRFRDIEITGETITHLKQWQHVAFSYDARSGKLSRLTNGIEDSVVWACDTGRYGGSPLRAAFPKEFKRDITIGGGFRGNLDSFRVRRIPWDNASISRYSDAPGRITSRVYDMGTDRSRLSSIAWDAEAPAGSAVFFEYRLSDYIFPPHASSPLWIRAQNGADEINAKEGRYLQWRATLVGAEQGRYTPVLKSVRLAWNRAYRPNTPIDFSVQPGDRRVLLKWRGNLDKIAGYRVYIGNERGEYLHPSSPIDVPLAQVNPREPAYVLYNLENDRLYYFAVVSYTEDGMQSGFSREAYARPGENERF